MPLTFRNRIGRADVAEAFVEAMQHPGASRTTFEIVQGKNLRRQSWRALLEKFEPDAAGIQTHTLTPFGH